MSGLLASYKAIPKIGAVEIVKDSKIFIFVDSFGNLCNIHITIDANEDKTKIPIQSFQSKGAVNVVQEYGSPFSPEMQKNKNKQTEKPISYISYELEWKI